MMGAALVVSTAYVTCWATWGCCPPAGSLHCCRSCIICISHGTDRMPGPHALHCILPLQIFKFSQLLHAQGCHGCVTPG